MVTKELETIEDQKISKVKGEIHLSELLVESVLVKDIDWGKHPGTESNALKDPGAAKIINTFNCYSDPEILYREVSPQKISFVIKTKLVNRESNEVVGTGIASCTTTETKYGYRWVLNPESFGFDKVGLKFRRKGNDTFYRIPNPETEELENTILKMAAKRAEVDAAQSLPGVLTALARIFNQPKVAKGNDDQWTRFWSQTKAMGLDRDKVHILLGVTSMKEWIDSGKTLADAIATLAGKVSGPEPSLFPDEPES